MTQRRIYQEDFPYFISTNTLNRKNLFTKTYLAAELYNTITRVCRDLKCPLYCFGIMPDHLHLIISAIKNVSISIIMQQIKSIYTKNLREKFNINKPIWQKRFNSRIIENEEGLSNAINYIINNPKKAGLDKKYFKKPYQYFNKSAIEELFGVDTTQKFI